MTKAAMPGSDGAVASSTARPTASSSVAMTASSACDRRPPKTMLTRRLATWAGPNSVATSVPAVPRPMAVSKGTMWMRIDDSTRPSMAKPAIISRKTRRMRSGASATVSTGMAAPPGSVSAGTCRRRDRLSSQA